MAKANPTQWMRPMGLFERIVKMAYKIVVTGHPKKIPKRQTITHDYCLGKFAFAITSSNCSV